MNKKSNVTEPVRKKLTVEDLKRVIGGLGGTTLTVEGTNVEDANGAKASGLAKASIAE